MGCHAPEFRFDLACRDGFADTGPPLPQLGLNPHEGEFNAPPVHDLAFGREGDCLASSSASSFNKISRVASQALPRDVS
jgi:hypothetical protein